MSARRKLRPLDDIPIEPGVLGIMLGDKRTALRELRDMVASPGEAMARAAKGTRRAMEKAGLSPVRGTMAPGMMGRQERPAGMKKGGAVKSKSKSKTNCRRGDGICKQGKTKGRMV